MRVPDPARFLPLKPDVFEILLALSHGERHGYAILKELDERSVPVAASLLYRKLRRLMQDDLVAEVTRRVIRPEDDQRRRYYRLTAHGRAVVRAEAARILDLARDGRVRLLAEGRSHA
jgi:DNA-binding PadR family transcriptional regulator